MRRRELLVSTASLGLTGMGLPALAQSQAFPTKTVRIVVPALVGSADVFARAMAQRLGPALGQSVIVEQKPGAGTNIGNDFVAKSAPDGHTLLINGLPLVTNQALYASLPYNTMRDLLPVIEVAEVTNVVTVHPGLGINSLSELVQQARNDPNKFNHGTPGAGSSGHLAAELMSVKTGAKFTHVPYQGNAQATNDHLGGTLQVGFVNLPVAMQFVKAGRLKALAVTGSRRSALLPDVPTVNEALGLNDYELVGWFGILAPAKTPQEVVMRLNAEINKLMREPSFLDIIRGAGGDPLGGTPAQFEARMRRDEARLSEVIRISGAKAN
jgi:tripartite-type tricarboxylate transporter receptor subunit TctC